MRGIGPGWRLVLFCVVGVFGGLTVGAGAGLARWTRPQLVCSAAAELGTLCGGLLSGGFAENSRGDAAAAWVDGNHHLDIVVAPRGGHFGRVMVFRGPEVIADDGVGVAIDARGRAIVAAYEGAVAESGSTPLNGVVVVRGTVGGGWSAPEQVSLPGEQPTPVTSGRGPVVAIRGGESAVGWTAVDWGGAGELGQGHRGAVGTSVRSAG